MDSSFPSNPLDKAIKKFEACCISSTGIKAENDLDDVTAESAANNSSSAEPIEVDERMVAEDEESNYDYLRKPTPMFTDQFKCGSCRKRETTYLQLQTPSGPVTFVTCVNCNSCWKFF